MFKSAAEELSQWALQCRRWTRSADTKEQRLTLQNWERLLRQAAREAQQDLDVNPLLGPLASTKP
jgi:hypothetical protein